MLERLLQINGDPSVRTFLFQQCRIDSQFDQDVDKVLDIVRVVSA